jgi:hypothetical protein
MYVVRYPHFAIRWQLCHVFLRKNRSSITLIWSRAVSKQLRNLRHSTIRLMQLPPPCLSVCVNNPDLPSRIKNPFPLDDCVYVKATLFITQRYQSGKIGGYEPVQSSFNDLKPCCTVMPEIVQAGPGLSSWGGPILSVEQHTQKSRDQEVHGFTPTRAFPSINTGSTSLPSFDHRTLESNWEFTTTQVSSRDISYYFNRLHPILRHSSGQHPHF